MQRKLLLGFGFALLAALFVSFNGVHSVAVSTSELIAQDLATNPDPIVRAAASDVIGHRWLQSPPSAAVLFDFNDVTPLGTAEGRRTGFDAQLEYIFANGDPLLGVPPLDDPVPYLVGITVEPMNPERDYLRSAALLITLRSAFFFGGAENVFALVQGCVNGEVIEPFGLPVLCPFEPVRRAFADVIAAGWYVAFGDLPAVGFDCAARLDQAVNGATVEARWAAAKAYVLGGCADPADVAQNGASLELRQAAVAPLAQALAQGGDAGALLEAASGGGSFEWRLANAYAAGLVLEKDVAAREFDCIPAVPGLSDNLYQYTLANMGTPLAAVGAAPLARYFASDQVFSGNRCSLARNTDTLKLTIYRDIGTALPLTSFVSTLP